MARTGGIKTEREVDENVYFHPRNAWEMFNYLSPHFAIPHDEAPQILDACAGSGILGKAVKEYYDISKTDFVDIKHGADVLNINKKYDIIVCNPPWSLKISLPIYWRLVEHCLAPYGVLFFIINNVFCYQGSDRAEGLKYQKYYFLPRWTFHHANRPLLDCGVMVYHKGDHLSERSAILTPYIPLTRQY